MSLLAKRFPRLSTVPRVPLVTATTVERLVHASRETGAELWVKRDDRTSEIYGGNKVRKLERLIGDARRQDCDTLVTTGAYGSHHALATSMFGRRWGFDVHSVLVPQRITKHVSENLRAQLGMGTVVHPVRTWAGVAPKILTLLAQLRLQGRRPYRIPHGGSSAIGAIGYVDAGLELAGQIDRREVPEPQSIHLALGSGGTSAGLAVGLAAAGLEVPIVAVRVTPLAVCNRWTVRSLVRDVIGELRRRDTSFPDVTRNAIRCIRIDGSMYGSGYGESGGEVEAAMARAGDDGLELDPTYTAKSYAAFIRDSRQDSGPRIYWHTLSSADLSELLTDSPPLPQWALS